MKKLFVTALLIVGLAVATGCEKSPADAPDSAINPSIEKQEVLTALESELDFLSIELRDDEESGAVPTSLGDGGAIAEAITPLRFGRRITSRTSHREVELTSDSTATVTITMELVGTLHILGATAGDTTRYEKPFTDHATRYLYMAKRQRNPAQNGRWHMVGLSGTLIESANGTVEIKSVKFSSASGEWTISDPLSRIMRENIPTLKPGEEVTVTVTTANTNDAVFAHAFPRLHHRLPMEGNGAGSYSFTWTPRHPGLHHLTVDAMSHNTLFDSAEAYNSMGWGFSYAVTR